MSTEALIASLRSEADDLECELSNTRCCDTMRRAADALEWITATPDESDDVTGWKVVRFGAESILLEGPAGHRRRYSLLSTFSDDFAEFTAAANAVGRAACGPAEPMPPLEMTRPPIDMTREFAELQDKVFGKAESLEDGGLLRRMTRG